MAVLTILHLSDLHMAESKLQDQKIVVTALLDDLDRLRKDDVRPDLVIFSGDLVEAGGRPTAFELAQTNFIDLICKQTEAVPFVIVPGNHDITRDTVRAAVGYVELGLKASLKTVDKLNEFVELVQLGSPAAASALERLSFYEKSFPTLSPLAPKSSSPLLRTYIINAKGLSIGVAGFNTAWRCTGEPHDADRNSLLLGSERLTLRLMT